MSGVLCPGGISGFRLMQHAITLSYNGALLRTLL